MDRYFIIHAHLRYIKNLTPPSKSASDSGCVALLLCSQALLLIHLQMGRHEERGRWRSSQALFPSALSDEVVLLKRLCLLWPGVTFGTLVDISCSIVSEGRELVSWRTVSLGIVQQDFSQSFAWLWDFLMLHICRECHFYHHTVGVFLLKCLCYPAAMGDLLPVLWS